VLATRDLDEAREASLAHPGSLALVIVDLLLPGAADGVLDRLGPTGAAARVLYLSGDLEDTVETYRGLRPGRGFLHKPFTVDALVQRTRELLGR
jgi:DNA-binding response OmpR family regulator